MSGARRQVGLLDAEPVQGEHQGPPGRVQTIYYKSGVTDYRSVRPFPQGPAVRGRQPDAEPGGVQEPEGTVEAGSAVTPSRTTTSRPAAPDRRDVQLNLRLQAPSCWDGIHLDTPDHKSHMAYPVAGGANYNSCPADHPVALPMIEFKMAWPVNGDMSQVKLASGGAGYSFHYDFMNGWDTATLDAMVTHCIKGGLQCDPHGYDENHPDKRGARRELRAAVAPAARTPTGPGGPFSAHTGERSPRSRRPRT
ncbi:DUF1996 domain-containing protein, partial [Streptomyces sp. SID7803]|nr:DUF1996 domain-containing protein [Streptomyces sp. SID7803]